MTSKEALKRIETIFPYNREYKPNYYTQFSSSYEPFYKDFDCIKQDLERLEKLEKAIEIMKSKTIIIFALKLSKDLNDYNRMTSFENLTQQEYEILKEVLNDE